MDARTSAGHDESRILKIGISAPIVAMEPGYQLGGSLIGALIGSCIGSFANRGLDEALGLTVGVGRIWLGEDLARVQTGAGGPESL